MKMLIDIGCGVHPHPRANVGLDLFMGHYSPDIETSINPQDIANPIRADAHHLPIRDKAFDKAYSRALLEHIANPTQALREMIRIAKEEVEIIIPHRCFRNRWWERPPKSHRWFFGVNQVRRWLESLGLRYRLRVERRGFPSEFLAIFWFPHLIHINIYLEA